MILCLISEMEYKSSNSIGLFCFVLFRMSWIKYIPLLSKKHLYTQNWITCPAIEPNLSIQCEFSRICFFWFLMIGARSKLDRLTSGSHPSLFRNYQWSSLVKIVSSRGQLVSSLRHQESDMHLLGFPYLIGWIQLIKFAMSSFPIYF